MPTAQSRASAKYNAKAYEEIKLRVKTGDKERIKKHAEDQGMSINGYINKLIEQDMKQGK